MKATEYGGSDTDKTDGIFPEKIDHQAHESMRLLAKTDPTDPESGVDIVSDFKAG